MEDFMDHQFYNRHYIIVRSDGSVIDAWSDGPRPDKDIANAICINEQGGYQFRFTPDGEENPTIYTVKGIPLYKWDGEKIVPRTKEELRKNYEEIPDPPPSEIERLRADIDFLAIMSGVSL